MCYYRLGELAHVQPVDIPARRGHTLSDLERVETGHEDPDEVHQVVPRESHRQGGRTCQDDYPKDVYPEEVLQEGHQQRPPDQGVEEGTAHVVLKVQKELLGNQHATFQPFENGEIGYRGERDASP